MRIPTLLTLIALTAGCSQQTNGYHLTRTIPIPGEGGWDFLAADESSRQLYVSHSTKVDVIDMDSGVAKGEILNTNGVHGIAVAPEFNRGFITDGKTNAVTVFNTKTLVKLSEIKVGKKPDAIIYDPATRHVFAFNGDSESTTVIDAKSSKTVGTIPLGGGPEFAVADGKGKVFLNLEDKSELLEIDSRTLKVVHRWSLAPGEAPSSMAMDKTNHRLFIGCGNKLLLVVNADTGKVITSLPIGDHVDATVFDPVTKQVIASNGDGTMTVIQQDSADAYRVAQIVSTPKKSKTLALDSKTHRLFVPAADFGPAPAPTPDNPRGRPPVISGSFRILVFEK